VSGSGVAAGAKYRAANVLPRGLDAQVGAMVSLRGYQEYSASMGWMDRDRSTVAFDTADTAVSSLFNAASLKTPGQAAYLDVRHRFYPRHRYFGAGIDSRSEDQGDYTLSGTSIDGVYQRQFTPGFGLSVRGGWIHLRTGAGHDDALVDVEDRFAAASLPGLTRQTAFATLGAGVIWDARNNPRAPEQGWFAGTSLRQFQAMSGIAQSFARATLDLRGYRQRARRLGRGAQPDVGRSRRFGHALLPAGLARRYQHVTGFSAPTASRTVRSPTGRWNIAGACIVTSRLRLSWTRARLRRSLARLSAGDIEVTPGIGLRARTDQRVLGRLDWSHSRDGHRVTFASARYSEEGGA
jgi:hypothetical protein